MSFAQKHCPQCCRPRKAGEPSKHWPGCTWARISTSPQYQKYHPNIGLRKMKRDRQIRKANAQRAAETAASQQAAAGGPTTATDA